MPEMTSWSLPQAMIEPKNETAPTIVENIRKIRTSVLGSTTWRNSTQAISAAAPPPTPLNSATICGIAVIFTERADGDADDRADHDAERDQAVVGDLLDRAASPRSR